MGDISSDYVLLVAKGAVKQGHKLESLLERAGITPNLVGNPEVKVTFQQISMLYKVIWKVTGDEHMGLSEVPCRLGNFRFLADTLSRYRRLDMILHYAGLFYAVTRDDTLLRLERERRVACLVINVGSPDKDPDNLLKEYYLMAWQRYICWLVDAEIQWLETSFSFARPDRADMYLRLFSGNLKFSASVCSFTFDSRYLNHRVNRSRSDIESYVKTLPLPLFTQVGDNSRYSQKVKNLLKVSAVSNLPGLAAVADELSMNPRTLHRKLVAEGDSFSKIKSRHQCEVGTQCLLEKNMRIEDISDYLGFSEPSSFCRFFKSVTGVAPSRYTTCFDDY